MLSASRPAERLGPHLLLALACVVGLVVIVLIAFVATRRRAQRAAAAMPALPSPPRPFPIPLIAPMTGVGLGTTAPGGWQDAAVRGVLGSRRAGQLIATCAGVEIAGLWLPASALRSVRIDERFATKFMPGTGLLVFGWEAAGREYESGFRGAASGYEEVVATVRGLLTRNVSDPNKARGVRA
ncbi:MAG: integral rane protein [Mycobacterium sp.]|nr:integral rane protein [Mycobacterium sp.]